MFTGQKCKLFFNDPKFRQIEWDIDTQETAVSKIFAGQRQLRRSKVANSTLSTSVSDVSNPYVMLDFLQARMDAYEHNLVINVGELFNEKERIKDKYSEAQDLYEKSNRKFKRLMSSSRKQEVGFGDIDELQKEVMEIQRLFEQNQFYKSLNNEIKSRIERKQGQLGTSKR